MVLAQRLLENVTHAPELEEDVALSNIALDLIGQARVLYTYAGEIEGPAGDGTLRDEDHYAYWRDHTEFLNPLLVEQPNGDFAHLIVRQFLHDAFSSVFWDELRASSDDTLAALATKAVKETAYHLRHSRAWVVRLGDGTDESHARTQVAVDRLWRYTGELFEQDGVEQRLIEAGVAPDTELLQVRWASIVEPSMVDATLTHPADLPMASGGRTGTHTEALSYLLGEMQVLARAHPGATW